MNQRSRRIYSLKMCLARRLLADPANPEQTECAELLTGSPVSNVEEAHRAGQELLKRGCGSVIITLGPQGCVVVEAQGSASKHVQTTSVKSVDTTNSTCLFTAKT
ncbi:hypothetical protein JOQ06_028357 [Pogonophryne albipinna]|uniref:Carbohydrate kinase PfkB domain-containing protein n=1 Tax=Pogonophryne albipinna TaxID=1090488 RepID=A0AAD6BB24_9TELE|nr:hypothetical protein JOQ06_028357 [Pogonophryne albipinna]